VVSVVGAGALPGRDEAAGKGAAAVGDEKRAFPGSSRSSRSLAGMPPAHRLRTQGTARMFWWWALGRRGRRKKKKERKKRGTCRSGVSQSLGEGAPGPTLARLRATSQQGKIADGKDGGGSRTENTEHTEHFSPP
jgi:hypothetical protein